MEVYKDIKITVLKESDGTWSTYFSSTSASGQVHGVDVLRDQRSERKAIKAGKEYVDEHQWQYISKIDIFAIYIRLWWNGAWGYSVRCGGMSNQSDFTSREQAITAAEKHAQKKIDELAKEIQKHT